MNNASFAVGRVEERWWVVFTDIAHRRLKWWERAGRFLGILPPGFGHCFCFREHWPGFVIVVNPLMARVETISGLGNAWHLNRDYLAQGMRVLVVDRVFTAARDADRLAWRGVPLTCASAVAYHIGLAKFPITPLGLRRVLIRDYGAREIHDRTFQQPTETEGPRAEPGDRGGPGAILGA